VKDRVDIPPWRELESNRYRRDDLGDFEWAVSSGCEFSRAVR
jgi:hypothetical protein